MGILNKLFGKKQQTESGTTGSNFIEVSNDMGLGDGTPLLVEHKPDVRNIFTDPNPPSPQQITDRNREYWKGADANTKHVGLAIAYMQHPDPAVRKATIEIAGPIDAMGVSQMLVDLLADPDQSVRQNAAIKIWERQRDNHCQFAIRALRDEIRGHTSTGFGTLTMGHEKAIQALNVLVEEAPNEDAHKAIQELIDRDVVIEENVEPVDISSVEFVGIEYKDASHGQKCTYEVYRAMNKQQALAFLKSKKVSEKLYYIEVETTEGNFGRDIDGMYDI